MYQFRKKGHLATALVAACILAQLCNGSPVPAPPAANQASGIPPITEEELHQMIEQLLMEAYGDEYEPPPPKARGSQKPTTSASLSQTMDVLLKDLNLFQEAALTISGKSRVSKQVPTHKPKAKVLQNFEPVLAASSPESTASEPEATVIDTIQTTPISVTAEKEPEESSTSAPVDLGLTKTIDELTTVTSSTSSLPTTSETASTSSGVRVTNPGAILPEELEKALVFEQAGQPKILIVDRRTKKSKSKPEQGSAPVAAPGPAAPGRAAISPLLMKELFPALFEQASANTKPDTSNSFASKPMKNDRFPTLEPAVLLSQSLSEGDKTMLTSSASNKRASQQSGSVVSVPSTRSAKQQGKNLIENLNLMPQAPTLGFSDIFADQTAGTSNFKSKSISSTSSTANLFPGISQALLHFRTSIENEDNNFIASPFQRQSQQFTGFNLPTGQSSQRNSNSGAGFQFSTVGVPLPSPISSGNTQSFQPQSASLQSAGVPLPTFNSQQSSSAFTSQGHQNQGNLVSSNFGVPLPPPTSQGAAQTISPQNINSNTATFQNFGVPLPTFSNQQNPPILSSQNQQGNIVTSSAGVPLPPSTQQSISTQLSSQNFDAFQNIGVSLPKFTNQQSSSPISLQQQNSLNALSPVGVPLSQTSNQAPFSNFGSGQPSTSLSFRDVGVPLPSTSNLGNTQSSQVSNLLKGMSNAELNILATAMALDQLQNNQEVTPSQSSTSSLSTIGVSLSEALHQIDAPQPLQTDLAPQPAVVDTAASLNDIPLMDLLREMANNNQLAIIPLGDLDRPMSGPETTNTIKTVGIPLPAIGNDVSTSAKSSKGSEPATATIAEQVAKQSDLDLNTDFLADFQLGDTANPSPSDSNPPPLDFGDFINDLQLADSALDELEDAINEDFSDAVSEEESSEKFKSLLEKKGNFFSSVLGGMFDFDLGTLIDLL